MHHGVNCSFPNIAKSLFILEQTIAVDATSERDFLCLTRTFLNHTNADIALTSHFNVLLLHSTPINHYNPFHDVVIRCRQYLNAS